MRRGFFTNFYPVKHPHFLSFTAGKTIVSKKYPVNSIQSRSNSVRAEFFKIIFPGKTIHKCVAMSQHVKKIL
jgi:hypothetical protein